MNNLKTIIDNLNNPNISTDALGLFTCILISFLFSIVITIMYRSFFEKRHVGSGVEGAFLIMGPAVTTIFLGIQFSLPLSLGLLGALSFVRFRTPIKQPEEIAYILLLIASSIGSATFNFSLVCYLLIIVFLANVAFNIAPDMLFRKYAKGVLLILIKNEIYQNTEKEIDAYVEKYFISAKLSSITTMDDMVSLYYRFNSKKTKGFGALSEQLKDIVEAEKVSFYLEGTQSI
jgi:hypothetical protein